VVNGGMLDLSTPGGRMVARQLGAVARYESEHRSERVRAKHRELAEKGLWPGGGHRPFGYGSDGVTLVPEEAAVVREAAKRVLAGESLRGICMDLDRRGIVGAEGGRMHTLRLKTILRSARISGQREHKGVMTKAVWPALVTPAQLILLRAKLVPGKRNRGRTLLAGLLVCGRCGQGMVSKPRARGIPCYGCKHESGGCGVNVRAAPLESYVMDQLRLHLDSPEAQAILSPPRHDEKDTDVAAIEQARANIIAIGEQKLSPATLPIMIAPWERQIADAEKRIRGRAPLLRSGSLRSKPGEVINLAEATAWLRTEMATSLGKWGPWVTSTRDQRRALLWALIERIVVSPAVRPGRVFQESRVHVVWR
jgi:site-specific DNA recombinase